jgi:hypothetical protein
MGNLWFSPVCDRVLAKLKIWRENYTRGEVESTCKFNTGFEIVDQPVRYMHRIAWSIHEFDHLVRVMEAICQNKALVDELKLIRKEKLPVGQIAIGGTRVVSIAFYPEYIDLMIKLMVEARDGKTKTMAEEIEEGGLF